ncbi:MAG: hypothetical protein Q7V88_08460 [Actinomycetota bacterium]|nr:hypothetical protein [Actinomycetota bacterium]
MLKRIAMLICAVLAVAVTPVATAHANIYPPGCVDVFTDASAYAPGAVVTLTAQGTPADGGLLITFTITLTGAGQVTPIVVSALADASGLAVATITAPQTPGSYTVTITTVNCGVVSSSFAVNLPNSTPTTTPTTTPGGTPTTTPGGGIPRAGSDSQSWVVTGTALLCTGLGFVLVARRRRHTSSAA